MSDYLNELLAAHTESEPLTWLLLANGEPAAHNNVLLFGFPAGAAEPTHVAKICRSPAYNQTIRNEYERLRNLWQALGPDAADLAPRPLALGQRGADLVLLLSYCAGRQLLPQPDSFWRDEARVRALWRQAADWLRHVHRRAAVRRPPAGAPQADFAEMADSFGRLFPLDRAERRELAALSEALAPAGDTAVLLQGDFWPGNVILRPGGGFTLVDWQFSRWSGDAGLDVYLFPLVCAVKAAPYAPPAERGRAAARILTGWQERLLPAYLRRYGDVFGYTLPPPRVGLPAVCVEMAVRPYLAFGLQQEDALLWRAMFAELSK